MNRHRAENNSFCSLNVFKNHKTVRKFFIKQIRPINQFRGMCSGQQMKRILFLRSGTDDSYEQASRDLGYKSYTINPIQKEFINLDNLAEKMTTMDFDAIVFTSQTSLEALVLVRSQELPVNLPVYVVGKATAQCARNLGFKNVIGENSGSSKNLASVILSENKTRTRFLFPGASKLIGGLKEPLETAGHELEILPVYQTTSRGQNDLQSEMNKIDSVDVAVYFSPSGVESIHHLILDRWPNIRTIAIGQSTAKSLPADKCEIAPSPDLEGNFLSMKNQVET